MREHLYFLSFAYRLVSKRCKNVCVKKGSKANREELDKGGNLFRLHESAIIYLSFIRRF